MQQQSICIQYNRTETLLTCTTFITCWLFQLKHTHVQLDVVHVYIYIYITCASDIKIRYLNKYLRMLHKKGCHMYETNLLHINVASGSHAPTEGTQHDNTRCLGNIFWQASITKMYLFDMAIPFLLSFFPVYFPKSIR